MWLEISAKPTGQKVIKKHLDDWIKEKESLSTKESPAKKFKTLQKKGIPSLHVEEVKSNDQNFKIPDEPKRKQSKKNNSVPVENKIADHSANVKSFKQKQTSPQKEPIRTNNSNQPTNEEQHADQKEKLDNNARSPSKSASSEADREICPPGFINVLQSRMVFEWFKELMKCREDSIGVGLFLECHSTNFQKSLYFVSQTPLLAHFFNSFRKPNVRPMAVIIQNYYSALDFYRQNLRSLISCPILVVYQRRLPGAMLKTFWSNSFLQMCLNFATMLKNVSRFYISAV